MWLMLQQDEPRRLRDRDRRYQHSVRDFAEKAVAIHLGMRIEWRNEGEEEIGFDARSGRRR